MSMDGDWARRHELVRDAVKRWHSQLIDLGGRNTLLYYRDLKAGTLDLAGANEVAVSALLDGRTVALSQLFYDTSGSAMSGDTQRPRGVADPQGRAPALRRART